MDNHVAHLGVRNKLFCVTPGGDLRGAPRKPQTSCESQTHLVLTGEAMSIALWEQSTGQLLKALPADMRETIEGHEKEGTTDSPERWGSSMKRTFARSLAKGDGDVFCSCVSYDDWTVRVHMTGTLKSWSCLDQIYTITTPNLRMTSTSILSSTESSMSRSSGRSSPSAICHSWRTRQGQDTFKWLRSLE